MALKKSATCLKQKTKILTTNFLKIWFLFFLSKKGQKYNKMECVTKSVGIIITIIFI